MIPRRDYAKVVDLFRSLHERDKETGQITNFPKKIVTYGYRRQHEIKDAEGRAVELMRALSALAQTDWEGYENDVEDLCEELGYFANVTRELYFDFDCAMKKLRERLISDINMYSFKLCSGAGGKTYNSKTEDETLSKALCSIADTKQILLGLLSYLIDKENILVQSYVPFDFELDYSKEDLQYYENIFQKVNAVRAFIDEAEVEAYTDRKIHAETMGEMEEQRNPDLKDCTTTGIVDYLVEEEGLCFGRDIKFYKHKPYLVGSCGKRLFVLFADKGPDKFVYSYNCTFDEYKTGNFTDVYNEIFKDSF